MKNWFPFLRSRLPLWLPVLVAAVNRWSWRQAVADSPLLQLNRVPGLDMLTHQELGQLFANGHSIFTPYRLLTAAAGSLERLLWLQNLGGVILTALVTCCAWRLSGKRGWTLAAGFAAALYAPALLYEQMSLQESTLTLLLFAAFAAALQLGGGRRARTPFAALTGVLFALTCCGRPVGLLFAALLGVWLWRRLRRRGELRARWWFLGCWFGGAVAITLYNLVAVRWLLPVYGGNLAYLTTVGRTSGLTTLNLEPRPLGWAELPGYGWNALCNLGRLFLPLEIPDNLNYYFLADQVQPGLLPLGPALLTPLAAWGLVLAFGWRRRWSAVAILTLTLALPVAAFHPLGRYRLMLYPWFCLLAPLPFYFLWRFRRDWRRLVAALVIPVLVLAAGFPVEVPRRSADYFAWGLATERLPVDAMLPGQPAVSCFALAFEAAPENTNYAVTLIRALLKERRLQEATVVIARARAAGNRAPELSYYGGCIALSSGDAAGAARQFGELEPESLHPDLRCAYCYFRSLAERGRGEAEKARHWLERARQLATTPEQRQLIELEAQRWQRGQ